LREHAGVRCRLHDLRHTRRRKWLRLMYLKAPCSR
jgi:hypothetical protein